MSLNLLATQLELFHAIFDKSCDAVLVVDDSAVIRHWSRAADKLLGHTASETIGKDFNELIVPLEYRESARAELKIFHETGRSPYIGNIFEAFLLNKYGESVWVDVSLSDVIVENKTWLFAIIRDVASRKERETRLEQEAKSDPLTGLANRSEFQIQLESRIGNSIALAFLDVDELKQINDKHGHPVGDEAILHVATCLKAVFKDAACVARLGGDEFGILFEGLDESELREWFQQFLADIASKEYSPGGLHVATSVGLAFSTPHSSARSLLTSADQAMYKAKTATGSNIVVVNDVN